MAADGRLIAHIALTTNMGASAGGIAATIVAWLYLGKPDLSMIVNGILAGLVSVTAPCAWITLPSAIIIGAIGMLVARLTTLMAMGNYIGGNAFAQAFIKHKVFSFEF